MSFNLKGILNNINFTLSTNKYCADPINNEILANLFNTWFTPRTKTEKEISIISKCNKRQLKESEIDLFERSSFKYSSVMSIGHKITHDYIIYYSSDYKRTKRSCSYVVEFKEANDFQYGKILYYLGNEETYAIITKINLIEMNFLYNLKAKTNNKNREYQNTHLNGLFKLVEETDVQSLIMCKSITAKCILIPLVVSENNVQVERIYITNFINEYEHD